MQTVYYNGVVYTGEMPYKEAFIVENGLFTFVGNTQEALALATKNAASNAEGNNFEKIDLQGCFVCPGFNDSHIFARTN